MSTTDQQAQSAATGFPRRQALATIGGIALGVTTGGLYRRARASSSKHGTLVRPPGAGSEQEFLSACIRCGQCVEACPPEYGTLRLADITKGISSGTPFAPDLRHNPCYICQGYPEPQCIKACPTDALKPLLDNSEIRMGLAVIDESTCWAYNGTSCRSCWHACPWPNEAIILNERVQPVVNPEACVGCGLCVHACPTDPESIVIRPEDAAADLRRVKG